MLICWMFNVQVIDIYFDRMTHAVCNDIWFITCNRMWDVITVLIPIVFLLIFVIKILKISKKEEMKKKG